MKQSDAHIRSKCAVEALSAMRAVGAETCDEGLIEVIAATLLFATAGQVEEELYPEVRAALAAEQIVRKTK